jgi:hypothetical protein
VVRAGSARWGAEGRVDEHGGHDRPLRRQLGNVRAGVAVRYENDIPVYGQRREEGVEDVLGPQHGLGHPADRGVPALVGKDTGDWAPHRRSQQRAGQEDQRRHHRVNSRHRASPDLNLSRLPFVLQERHRSSSR